MRPQRMHNESSDDGDGTPLLFVDVVIIFILIALCCCCFLTRFTPGDVMRPTGFSF